MVKPADCHIDQYAIEGDLECVGYVFVVKMYDSLIIIDMTFGAEELSLNALCPAQLNMSHQ